MSCHRKVKTVGFGDVGKIISGTSHRCSKKNYRKRHPSYRNGGLHGHITASKHRVLRYSASKDERMVHSSARTSWCLNIQNGNISVNIDSHTATLLSSADPNLSERKPSKASSSNVVRPVYALLLGRGQRIFEKGHGALTGGQIESHTIACKKRLKCFIP